jgi:hypothetical protein
VKRRHIREGKRKEERKNVRKRERRKEILRGRSKGRKKGTGLAREGLEERRQEAKSRYFLCAF